ncbi:MAG TPA: TonB-dependent receptor [bacterium]
MRLKIILFFLSFLIIANRVAAINSGTLSGKIIDQETGQELPGAAVVLIDTKLSTIADKYGYYFIQNIPPGIYDIRVRMLGYAVIIATNVIIRADHDHHINFEMVSKPLEFGREIVITAEKPLIQKDIPSSSYSLDYLDLNRKLPIDHFYQTIKLHSATVDGHIRGGRKYDALYMVDGLPIQDSMFREISTIVPLSAISDINIYPGGFNAEYGQAMSGLINLTTKEGKDKTEGFFKLYTDNLGLKVQNDNLRRMELSLGGPLLVGFGGPVYDLNYYVSGNLNFDDMQFSNSNSQSPYTALKAQNYHYTTKLSFQLWRKLKFVVQNITSSWQVRDDQVDPDLTSETGKKSIDHNKDSHRFNFTVIHTLNPQSFYTFSCGQDNIRKELYNKFSPDENSLSENFGQSSEMIASRDWIDVVDERNYFLKAIYYRQFGGSDLIKFGAHLNFYRIFMTNLQSSQMQDSLLQNQSQATDILKVKPYTVSIFAQNKIEYENFLVNIGLRFDYFNPNIRFPQASIFSIISAGDTLQFDPKEAGSQFQLSPRIGLSFPFFSKNDRVHLNYGWFFQTPPLYYFYLNSSFNFNFPYPLVGNPELEAEKTEAFEVSYQKELGAKTLFGATFFAKFITNLVNTKNYYIGDNYQSNYSKFENLDKASIKGLEIFVEKRPGDGNLFGKLSYTYCKAIGSGSFPDQNYYSFVQNPKSSHNWKSYPLAWDQRHKFSSNISYSNTKKIEVNLLSRINSPLPLLDEQFQIIDRGKWRYYIDVRVIKSISFLKGELSPYFEILNLLNDQEEDRISNPFYVANDNYWMSGFDYYRYDYGRRFRVGLMINF